jgi:alpha-N-arabinofuranosidase
MLSTNFLICSLAVSSPYTVFERFEYTGKDVTAESDFPSGFYRNPILAGFHPDPSLCRVGKDYYLVNSTFEYFPGLPIFHSTDLVNWEQIGHVIHRPEQLDYTGRRVSNGLFAPAISYHDGKFYVVCTMVDGFGNFVVTAENPGGPWSDPISVGFQGIDPSTFFDDDGRAWIVNNDAPQGPPQYEGHRAIWIQEFDYKTTKMVGSRKMIVDGGVDISQKPIWIEGPHIYKRNDWYYLCCAEGGTSTDHSQVILRSKKVDGPYVPWDKNPILTQRDLDGNVPGAVTCTGHADLEIGPDGNWWAVFLAVRPYQGGFSPMGRETFLLPVTWTDDDWPVILPPGQRVPLLEKAPKDAVVRASGSAPLNGSFTWRDDFREKDLSLEWIMLREPDKQWWNIDPEAGKLRLTPQFEKLYGTGNPSYLGRRVRHAVYTAALTVEVPEEEGVSAGMALFMNERHHYFLAVHRSSNHARIYLERVEAGQVNQIAAADLPSVKGIDLRIETRMDTCSFLYKFKDHHWETLIDDADATLISYTVPDGMFLGATVGPHVRIDNERCFTSTGKPLEFKSEGNPLFRDAFTADPAPLVVGDTLYVYVGHDEAHGDQMFNITEWLCYSTQDMETWTAHGPIMKPTDFKWAVGDAWASQVVEKEGKFYFYTTVQHGPPHVGKAIGVAVSDSPTGPFVDARGTALVTDGTTPSDKPWDDIDPTVLIDEDGTAYMAWGNPYLYFARLKPNMIEIDGEIERIDLPNYTEGPWLHKRGDTYYLTYAAFAHQGMWEKICYATAPKITGPWTYQGILTDQTKNSYTIHPGIVEFKDQWYLFYHNADLTLNGEAGGLGRRSVCVEYLHYNDDGTMQPVKQTKEGVSITPAAPAQNPIIRADVPDVAVIRVGDTYYMSSTTMHMSPGLPIMKSKDLVNWNLVGYAYDRLVENDAMNLENGRNCYGAGSWASSLRYHNETYYATTFSSTSARTHIYTTRDIEKGDWKAWSFSPSLHDNTLFFDDDGRVYMIYGAGKLTLVELLADLSGIKEGGVNQVIIENVNLLFGESEVGGLNGEGSQLIKVNGKYYLLNIASPRSRWSRSVLVHRADTITGPWEGRVALEDKGVAQGCLIDTPDGKWYAMLFQDNGAVGRSPWLVPVKWEDGWPVFGTDGKAPETLDIEGGKKLLDSNIVTSDEFDRQPGEPLPLAWQWNHNPDNSKWSIGEREGHLRITTGRIDNNVLSTRNILTQRTFGPVSSAATKVEVTNMKDGDYAGLIALQQRFGAVCVKMKDGAPSIVMMGVGSQRSDRRGRGSQTSQPVEIESVPLAQSTVYFKIDCDFRNRTDKAYFYYSLDNKSWTKIGSVLQMSYTMPHFMGYRFGLFNYATKTAGGYVDFDYYRVTDETTLVD